MREIKFRAWNKRDKVFEVGVHTNFSEKYGVSKAVKRGYQWNDFENGFTVYDSPLMQYTGLKDKHDQEIYEGDIVNQLSEMTYDDIQGVVKFIDGSYLIETADGKTGNYLFGEVVYNKVVGNIHENPELLVGDNN